MVKANLIEYVVIVAYLAFMLITGVAFRKFIHNFADYFRSGCRGTWWLVGASIFMFSFSAWTFTGAAGVAYLSGISVAVIFIANALGYLINCVWTAPLFRQMRAITFPEVIRERFNTSTQQLYVWLGVVPGIFMAGLTLWGVAVFASAVFGFNIQAVIFVLGLVVLVYSTIGGSWSVMATDFLQALILMPLAVLVCFLSLKSIGGFDGLLVEIERQNLPDLLSFVDSRPDSQFTSGWIAAMFVFVILSYNSLGSALKYFSCKDGREARKAAGLAAGLMLLGSLLWFLPPIVAKLQFSESVEALKAQGIKNPAEASYAVISLLLLPKGLAGLIVVAMFSATMSSLDSQLNQFAAILTQDIYKPFVRPKASHREMFLVGQLASLGTGLLIIGAALYLSLREGQGLFDYMMKFGSLLGTPMIVPMFLVLFIRKAPVWSGVISICCAFGVSFLGWRGEWSYQASVFSIVAAGTLSFLLTLPFWRASSTTYQEKVEAFYRKMHTPVDFEKEVGQANDESQLRIVGFVSLSIGVFISLLALLPNPVEGRLQILFVSLCVIGFGGAMLTIAYRRKKRKEGRDGARSPEGVSR